MQREITSSETQEARTPSLTYPATESPFIRSAPDTIRLGPP